MTNSNANSGIASFYDKTLREYKDAIACADNAISNIKNMMSNSGYSIHHMKEIEFFLERYKSDPELFVYNFRNNGGARIYYSLTSNHPHGFDGSYLPQDDEAMIELVRALTKRNERRSDARENWAKLLPHEQSERERL